MTTTSLRRKHLTAYLFTLVFPLLLGVWLSVAPAFGVVLEFHAPVTYNMQGGTAGYQSKWTSDVAYLCQTHDVVLLQEAGPGPPASSTQILGGELGGYTFEVSKWNLGTASRPDYRYIYFLQTDPTGNRVNLAIVLKQQADQYQLAPAGITGQSRPALGVRLGALWFYTVHAFSPGGNDAPNLLSNIAAASSPYYWVALGDYNQAPSTLATPPGSIKYSSGQATQVGGGELDYAVSNDRVLCPNQNTNVEVIARRLNGLQSDHTPVDLFSLPCPNPANPPNQTLPNTNLVIMPLGDSITAGYQSSDNNGYRQDLQTELIDCGRNLNFVGSESIGTMVNPQNEGHYGYRIDQLSGSTTTGPVSRYNPNIVLLHAGTNDMNQNYQFSSAEQRLQDLIYSIYDAAPDTTILVAKIIMSTDPAVNTRIQSFNESVASGVAGLQSLGKRIALVDMSAVTAADMADSLHPNDEGYQKMADAWDEAIVTTLENGGVASRANIGPRGGSGGSGVPGPVPAPAAWSPLGAIASGVGAPQGSTVRFADIDGDGKADYIAVYPDSSIDVYFSGGGSAGKWIWYPKGKLASGIGVPGNQVQFADLDGDGRADYIAVNSDSSCTAYINGGPNPSAPGSWIWYPYGKICGGIGVPGSTIHFADINGDGRADYLSVDPKSGAVTAYLGQGGQPGNWDWIAMGVIATGVGAPAGSQVLFADINHDGFADYLAVSSVNGNVRAWLSEGGSYQKWGWNKIGQVMPGNGAPSPVHQVAIADIDGDGKADYLSVVPSSGAMQAWLNNGLDTSSVAGWLPLGQLASGEGSAANIRLADIDGNGLADYIVVDPLMYTAQAWLNQGPGQNGWIWVPQGQIANGGGLPPNSPNGPGPNQYIDFGDVNGDGKADYLADNVSAAGITAFLSGGPGPNGWIWYPQNRIAPGKNSANITGVGTSIVYPDMNGDGFADFVFSRGGNVKGDLNLGAQKTASNWFDGDASDFKYNFAYYTGGGTNVLLANVNVGDKEADYLIIGNNGSVTALINGGFSGTGINWISAGQICSGSAPSGTTVKFADLNGDGRADYIVLNNTTGALQAWLNNGTDVVLPGEAWPE